jgi:hypothetical protein
MPTNSPKANINNAPQVFSGPRGIFRVEDTPVGYAQNVSGEETIDFEPVEVIGLLEVREHVPVAYRCTLNAAVFRVIGHSIKKMSIMPTLQEIVTSGGMSAAVVDAVPVNGVARDMAFFQGVRCSGHTWDTGARGLTSDNIPFVAIKVEDEFERG